LLPLICFEDTVPHLVRDMVQAAQASPGRESGDDSPVSPDSSSRIDCLVNLTNDGWFRDSSEPDQHLITASFRCIELRKPMVRAVNTGISAVIDGDGVVREPEVLIDFDRLQNPAAGPPRTTLRDPATGRYYKSFNSAQVANVLLDNRDSLYLAYGDWFAAGCLVLTMLALGVGWSRRERRPAPAAA
jgi:apolipoprotein N-acyltransferase